MKTFTLNNKNTDNPILKWSKNLNRHFSKKYIQMASKHIKGTSNIISIREVQIVTTLYPVEWL